MGFWKAPWWKKLVVLSTLLVVLVGGCTAAYIAASVSSLQTEQEWYEEKAEYLSTVEITPEMIAQGSGWKQTRRWSPEEDLDKWPKGWSCELRGPNGWAREGCIRIGADDGVYVVCQSSHHLDGVPYAVMWKFGWRPSEEEPPVEDATLAVDREGNLYTFDGHICSSLWLHSEKQVLTLEDLLRTTMHGDEKWEVYEAEER